MSGDRHDRPRPRRGSAHRGSGYSDRCRRRARRARRDCHGTNPHARCGVRLWGVVARRWPPGRCRDPGDPPARALLTMTASPVRRPLLEAGYLDVSGTAQPDPQGLRTIVQPRGDGTCLIGSSREFKGEDRTVDSDLAERMKQRAARFVPALAKMRPAHVTVGFRPYTPLDRPIIGWAGPDGFLVATGHEGQGITLAPVTGKFVSDLVAGRIRQTGFELPR